MSRYELAGKQHLEGLLAAKIARQGHARRHAEQPDADSRGREAGVRRGDREIRIGDHLATGRRGDPVDPRNHRLRDTLHRRHHASAFGEQMLVIILVGIAAHFLQVMAGTEGFALAGDDDDAD